MNEFRLVISSCLQIVYEGNVNYCGITTPDGSLGIEAHHEPFFALLREKSEIILKSGSNTRTIQAASGFLSFNENSCLIAAEVL
ncbi:MAG: hypothetical protein A2096_16915 [Spirochaetes bacterium GWF1_41_5]|nr:MAG: hypothetical protein A2096_16915 [Spirochaetes bacterium GWF1_41_5]HBE02121.1 hypothetical protein [Spirochaetia bacterium]